MPTTLSKSPCHSSPRDRAQLEAPLRGLLSGLCADAERHGRFLNTLSLLEHIGSRKSGAHIPSRPIAVLTGMGLVSRNTALIKGNNL